MSRASHRYFLISPADCSGRRAQMLLRPEAEFELARRIRDDGAPLGEVFAFLSSLYFRGKLAYARRFARPRRGESGVFVITANRGLLDPDVHVGIDDLKSFAQVPIDSTDVRYRTPLADTLRALSLDCSKTAEIVLLGSVGTSKYLDVAAAEFGERLLYPTEFLGRGDMSRGGLLLRSVRDDCELDYRSVAELPARGRRRGAGVATSPNDGESKPTSSELPRAPKLRRSRE